jgi:hypothetical protein
VPITGVLDYVCHTICDLKLIGHDLGKADRRRHDDDLSHDSPTDGAEGDASKPYRQRRRRGDADKNSQPLFNFLGWNVDPQIERLVDCPVLDMRVETMPDDLGILPIGVRATIRSITCVAMRTPSKIVVWSISCR